VLAQGVSIRVWSADRKLVLIILVVDQRSRISTSFFTSGRSEQHLWSSN